MIIIASYTGNLAAFLVLNRPETESTGINDSRLRNPTDNYTYATVRGSAVEAYFKRQVELSNIYNHMIKNKQINSVEAGIEAVRNNEINAFIYDSARLEYEASQDCELFISSEQFGRSGYGVGLIRNSFWTERVNEAILSMHERGFMERLDNEWILNPNPECVNRDSIRSTLGLKNMAGVFILVGLGIVGGIGLIMVEMIYKKQQNKAQRQLENARRAADRWRKYIQRKRNHQANLKAARLKQLEQQSLSGDLSAQIRLGQLKRAEYANSRSTECQSTCTETRLLQESQTSMDNAEENQNYATQSSLDQTPYWQQQNSLISQSSQDYLIDETTTVKKPINETQIKKTSYNKRPIQMNPIKVHIEQHNQQLSSTKEKRDRSHRGSSKKYSSMNELENNELNQRLNKKQLKHYQQLKHQHAISGEMGSNTIFNQQQQHQQQQQQIQNYSTSYRTYNDSYSTIPSHAQSTVTSMSLSRSPINQQIIKPSHVLAQNYNQNYNQNFNQNYNQNYNNQNYNQYYQQQQQQQNQKNDFYTYGGYE